MRQIVHFALACLLGTGIAAAGDIYRWKDANGTWHFSDQPQPGAELVRGSTLQSASTPVAPAGPAASTELVATSEPQVVSPDVARQVRAEAAAVKSEQCKKAEEAYRNSINAQRIYRVDDKGNRTYLTDAEIDAARLEARSNRDLACGP